LYYFEKLFIENILLANRKLNTGFQLILFSVSEAVTGEQFLCEGRSFFERFRETTEEIPYYQPQPDDQRRRDRRMSRLYRQQLARQNHARNASVRSLFERLFEENVCHVNVGDREDMSRMHWRGLANKKQNH
jgi:hypothetical protein